jgi:hypothetical protein
MHCRYVESLCRAILNTRVAQRGVGFRMSMSDHERCVINSKTWKLKSADMIHKGARQVKNAIILFNSQGEHLSFMSVSGGFHISITRVSCISQSNSVRCKFFPVHSLWLPCSVVRSRLMESEYGALKCGEYRRAIFVERWFDRLLGFGSLHWSLDLLSCKQSIITDCICRDCGKCGGMWCIAPLPTECHLSFWNFKSLGRFYRKLWCLGVRCRHKLPWQCRLGWINHGYGWFTCKFNRPWLH